MNILNLAPKKPKKGFCCHCQAWIPCKNILLVLHVPHLQHNNDVLRYQFIQDWPQLLRRKGMKTVTTLPSFRRPCCLTLPSLATCPMAQGCQVPGEWRIYGCHTAAWLHGSGLAIHLGAFGHENMWNMLGKRIHWWWNDTGALQTWQDILFANRSVGLSMCAVEFLRPTPHILSFPTFSYINNIMVENIRVPPIWMGCHHFPHCLMAHPSNNGENDDNPWWPLVWWYPPIFKHSPNNKTRYIEGPLSRMQFSYADAAPK